MAGNILGPEHVTPLTASAVGAVAWRSKSQLYVTVIAIDYLRGDEWIIMEGLHPSLPRLFPRRRPCPLACARLRMRRLRRRALVELVEAGKVTVRVAETYPLERAADAQRALREGHSPGKIILEIP